MPENAARFQQALPSPSLAALFTCFARISISGFGGVLAWSRRVLVDEKRWMSPSEFNELYALCQVLPGPNIVNLSVMFGARIRGVRGAAIAFLGLMSPAVALILVIGALYSRFGALPGLRGMLAGLAAAAAGLIVATSIKIAQPLLRTRPKPAHLIASAAFVAIGVLHFPLQWVLALLVPISVALAWTDRL
jgi:chromate transporter